MDEVKDVWIDQVMSGELKENINLFIWQWGHPQLTLAQAEKIAVSIFDMLSEQPKKDDCKPITNYYDARTKWTSQS